MCSFQIVIFVVGVALIGTIHADIGNLNPLLPPLNANELTSSDDNKNFDVISVSTKSDNGVGLFHGGQPQINQKQHTIIPISKSADKILNNSPKSNIIPGSKCGPGFVGKEPNCRAEGYIPLPPDVACENGTVGYPPNCYVPCKQYEIGIPPNCVRARCPPGWQGDYYPNCTWRWCQPPTIGLYPHCFEPEPYVGCPDGKQGIYPKCYDPCPAYRK